MHVTLLLSLSKTLVEQWKLNPCSSENSISSYDESYFGYTSFLSFLPTFDQQLAFNTLSFAIAALHQCLPEAFLQTMSRLHE